MKGGPTRRAAGPPWRLAAGWLLFLGPFFYATYGFATWLTGVRAAAGGVGSIVFDWERRVPFVAWTIFPYWSINLFYAASLFACLRLPGPRHVVRRHARRLLGAQVVAVACFLVMPLAFSFGQPAVDGAAGALFAALRSFDRPYNQAPSLHIALVVILWDLYRRVIGAGPLHQALLAGWFVLIAGSVLTTWQHHFIDIPTGALLGLLCVAAWPLERVPTPWAATRWTREPQRRRLALRYAAGALVCAALGAAGGGWALWLLWPAVALALVALAYALLGARGFGKHRDGVQPWAIQALLAPYQLGARVNAWAWTRRHPDDSGVADGVSIGRLAGTGPGGAPAGAATTRVDPRVDPCVDLCAELPSPRGTAATVAIPVLDLVVPDARALRRAAAAIERLRQRHLPVRVTCALGYSRSAAAVATWLAATGRCADVAAAVAQVRAARPAVVLSAAQIAAIEHAVRRVASGDAATGRVADGAPRAGRPDRSVGPAASDATRSAAMAPTGRP